MPEWGHSTSEEKLGSGTDTPMFPFLSNQARLWQPGASCVKSFVIREPNFKMDALFRKVKKSPSVTKGEAGAVRHESKENIL